jgi:hypothetical protein
MLIIYIHVVKLYTLHIVYWRKTEINIVTPMFVSYRCDCLLISLFLSFSFSELRYVEIVSRRLDEVSIHVWPFGP